jgi:hypothetical protein
MVAFNGKGRWIAVVDFMGEGGNAASQGRLHFHEPIIGRY